MFKRFAALAAVVVVCAACVISPAMMDRIKDRPPKAIDEDGRAYLARVMQAPLIFTVAKERSDEVWSLVNSFIANYSSMKVQTASDYIISTYNPSDVIHYGYSATRAIKAEGIEIVVMCFSGGLSQVKKIPEQNARILALYLQTGELRPEFIVQ